MKSTKFSIVVPTFNSAKTILSTLESLSAQRWMSLEVLIVDGGSTDDTLALISDYVGLSCVVISEKDRGIYDAINKGIRISSGDLICIIGSDDSLADGALKAVDEAWRSDRADIVAGKALLVKPDGSSSLRVDETYGVGALVSGIPFCHNAMFVTPAAYQRVGMYSLDYKICADAHWVHRSIVAGCRCIRVNSVIVQFSLGGTSSNNDELIMAETYSLVRGNFPELSQTDAEIVFKVVRGWIGRDSLSSVLSRYASNSALSLAIEAAMAAKYGAEASGEGTVSKRRVKEKFSLFIVAALAKLSLFIKS
ncbi:glycosyltransferase [Pseudomonas sp. SK3(2021)]|uniref:glycosyltransferase family 2 protein n=1 Tax=Pseudomonas sp. SK3(2021) TaxID=2841064 RepID=UPI00192CC1D5|nr:glycosyltransferase family 2 protein [Pseudomonas sp. SK3(2021)]QQZ40477.1 glycosyltransferase [Pseudomonas sp. SK3(2021)]